MPPSMQQPTANGQTSGTNKINGTNSTHDCLSPIAIVGMACRFAGDVTSPTKLWDLCAEGRDCWSPIPKERFDAGSLHHADRERPGRNHAIGGYFMNQDVARFDAAFFNFPADVASAMDPQIRLLLEIVYEATEDAGMPIEALAGTNTSVFAGCYGKDYHDLQTRDPEAMPSSFLTGNYTAMLSNRISHFYNLKGASMSIDTGCSSGLACLHQGCQTIRTGESDLSIVGASSTMLNPDLFVAMSTLGMIGTDGRCYAWEERAQGYGRGEGVAVLVLKSLDAALRDADHVHAIIRQTGLNQDGKTQSITSPSVDAQVQLIRDCYRRAGLDPSQTGYIEAHMTGTQVGDLAEAEALAQTFGSDRRAAGFEDPVLVGSVKTNIGHTEPVSGLAAIIKAAFAMRNKKVPGNLNYAVGNPKINLGEWNLIVPTTLTAWPKDKPLRVSINNFGYGGANSHVILEGAPLDAVNANKNGHAEDDDEHHEPAASRVFILSARDAETTKKMASGLAAHLRHLIDTGTDLSLDDLAYTLAERRSRLGSVAAVKARTLNQLLDGLEGSLRVHQTASKMPRLGFVFNGQGAQWHAMGRELMGAYPVFAEAITDADEILRSYGAEWSLKEELLRDAKSTRVSEIDLSQPLTVALQLCLVQLLRSWNIHPQAVVSHSSGEVAAAYTVGALSFREALGVVYYRGKLVRKYSKLFPQAGGMLAAGIAPGHVGKYTTNTSAGGRVVVACVNSPESVTLSGDLEDLNEVAARMEADGLFVRKLKVPMAYHSHHMLPMAAEYTELLRGFLPTEPSWAGDIIFASPVTGVLVDSPAFLTPEHWTRNLTSPVLFNDAFEAVSKMVDAVVEIGPHSTLSGPIRQILKGNKLPYVSCLKRPVDAVETMQDLASELLGLGYPVLLRAVNGASPATKLRFLPDLPTYPWNHTSRYWVESRVNKDTRIKRFPPHELLGVPVSGTPPLAVEWRNFLRLADVAWLADHRVESQVILPGAAYVSMAIEAARLLTEESGRSPSGYRVRNVDFLSALTVPETSAVEVRLRLDPVESTGWHIFHICSQGPSDTWTDNCSGHVCAVDDDDQSEAPTVDSFLGVEGQEVDMTSLLGRVREMGIDYGPSFRNLVYGRATTNRTVTGLRISDAVCESGPYIIHPATLDCIIQATYISLPDDTSNRFIVLPRSIQSLYIPAHAHKQAGEELQVFTELQRSQKKGFTSAALITNAGTDIKTLSPIRIEKLFCQAVPRGNDDANGEPESRVSRSKIVWELDVLNSIPEAIKDAMRITLTDDEIALEKSMLRASYYFISDAVSQLEKEGKKGWEWHHKVFFDWMITIVGDGKKGKLGPGSAMWSRATRGMKRALFDNLERGGASEQLTARVGAKLADIVCGRVTPLELMMEGGLLNTYYMELPKLKARSYKHLSRVVELFAIKNPGAKVLEIGGGTGGATQVVLESFGARGSGAGTLLDSYTFTDVSSGFFEAARQKLAAWDGMIDFHKLDIEADPVKQSDAFAAGAFDLIVASMVLHATKSLETTMKNVRKLLKPGGKLVLVETTQDKLDMQLIFGTLPGWWLSEEPTRNMSPNVSKETWDEVLRDTGFSGIDFEIGDCEDAQYQCSSIIASTAVATKKLPTEVSVVYTGSVPEAWNKKLVEAVLEKTGISVTIEHWETAQPENKMYIFTGDMTGPFLDGLDQVSFDRLRQLLLHSRGMLWLSNGSAIDAKTPAYAQTYGLLRTLRQEDASKRYIHLDFDDVGHGPWTSDKIFNIVHVLEQAFDENIELDNMDWEYAVKSSMLHVPRVIPDETNIKSLEPEQRPFNQPGESLVWDYSESIFTKKGRVSAPLPSETVEVEVKAFGVKPYHPTADDEDTAFYEVAGIVVRLGTEAEASGLRPGDRIGGLFKGPFGNIAHIHWSGVVKVPNLSSMEAAVIPIAYATAYHALINVARLQKGESVLIHQATDDVGQAAVAVAQSVGANVFAAFGDVAERNMLVNKLNLSAHDILALGALDSAACLKSRTKGKGVDIVFHTPSSQTIGCLQDGVSRFGRYVWTPRAGAQTDQRPDWASRKGPVTHSSVDMIELAEYDSGVFHEAMVAGVQILSKTSQTQFISEAVVEYPISQIKEALRHQDQNDRVLVVVRPEEVVSVIPSVQPLSLANPDSTYMIIGGLGGIGRAVASWMISKGAQHVLIVSRNAERHPGAPALLELSAQEGRNLQIRNCDISSEESLRDLLHYADASMPPIGGVVDAAMVLDDAVLERMTFEQWKRAVLPKVFGTINLEKQLPRDLSFFVLLSSLTGVAGHLSQANYSAGNTFQNAFARHRVGKGQAAVSIDLSAVSGVGYVADADDGARTRIEALGSTSIPVEEVLSLLEKAIGRRPAAVEDAQVIVGLQPWGKLAPDATVRRDRRFGTLRLGTRRAASATGPSEAQALTPSAMLTQALGRAKKLDTGAEEAVARAMAARLALLFNVKEDEIGLGLPLATHGVDSLVAVELRNWLAASGRAKVSIFEILHASSLYEMAALVLTRSGLE
ncbi:type I polyketide synthase [Colletotrichum cereale]|nr:type I polyketide synthase [Colletotrichum cereale]